MARITIFIYAVTTIPALAAAQGPRSGDTSSGAIDSGAIDSGAIDSGAIDSGAIDSGAIDSGAIDSSTVSSASYAANAERVQRLDGWLRHQADEMRFARRVVGPLSLATGALMLVPGVYGLADGVYDEQPNLGWLALGVAGLGFAQGAVWLAIQSDPEERYARWRAALDAGLDASELARFEGELRGTPNLARMERALIRWSGIGFLFGGALYAGLLATDDDLPDRHRVLGWVSSGIYAAVGLALVIYASLPELGETSWRGYEAGEQAPHARPRRVEVAFSPYGGCAGEGCMLGGLLAGRFGHR